MLACFDCEHPHALSCKPPSASAHGQGKTAEDAILPFSNALYTPKVAPTLLEAEADCCGLILLSPLGKRTALINLSLVIH